MATSIDKITQKKISAFKEEIDKMSKLGILPFTIGDGEFKKSYSAESLRNSVDDLQKFRLTIAVCGAVKVGKSTFLNSLLFGQDVLPTFETPCTAKLTFITYSEGAQTFTVEFFDASEYKDMKSKLPPDARAEWDRRETKAINSGVSPSKLFGQTYDGSGDNEFHELQEYIAEDGKYVSFVKQVTLRINRPELKNLFVVDTPGLDDPNPLNSWVTEQWANQAHAVIYLMPWRGLNVEDKKFIQRNFGEMAKGSVREGKNRVFVITQIDKNKDWISVLKQFKGDYPAEKDNVCGYSAYVELMRQREAAGELSDDEQDLLDGRYGGFNADPQNVREKIAKKLYSGDVEIRAEKCENIIRGCYSDYLNFAKGEQESLKVTEKNLGLSVKEAECKIEKLKKCQKDLNANIDNVTQSAANRIAGIGNVSTKLDVTRDLVLKTALRRLEGCAHDSQILPSVSMAVDDVNSKMRAATEKLVEGFIADAEQAFANVSRDVRMMIDNSDCDSQIKEPDTTVVHRLAQKLKESIDTAVDLRALDDKISFFNSTETNVRHANAALSRAIEESGKRLEIAVGIFVKDCRAAITAYASATKDEIVERFDELMESKKMSPDEKRKEKEDVGGQLDAIGKKIGMVETAVAECSFA